MARTLVKGAALFPSVVPHPTLGTTDWAVSTFKFGAAAADSVGRVYFVNNKDFILRRYCAGPWLVDSTRASAFERCQRRSGRRSNNCEMMRCSLVT